MKLVVTIHQPSTYVFLLHRTTSNFTGTPKDKGNEKQDSKSDGCKSNGDIWIQSEIQVPNELKIINLKREFNLSAPEQHVENVEGMRKRAY